MTAVDWEPLQSLATKVMATAYPPYSDFPAGAAGRIRR
jgi:cytidine deaminase